VALTSSQIAAEREFDDRIEAADRELKHLQSALDVAKAKRDTIAKNKPDRAARAFDVGLARKHVVELVKLARLEVEARKIKKLQDQIAACTVAAPIDGPVLYANDTASAWRKNKPAIEAGARVRERQKIFSIPELGGSLQVLIRVRESMVD